MSGIITVIHIIVCFILIIAVLLQSGKAADLAGAFGGGGSQTVFGPRGAATILSKATTICAIVFMLTSLGLWMLSARGVKSAVKGEEAPAEETGAVTETKKEAEETKPPATEKKEQKSTETEKKK
ncbi:MAG: preprotein translocase subunit SecG [Candidatus Aminicenantes bacterium]|nr:preprotein translocase subunit SecG [Candidatus Aminicenantes bacterium]